MAIRKIFVRAGHGGNDPGAVANGLVEKTMTLTTALKLKELLLRCGFEVNMARDIDVYVDLMDGVNQANNWGADLFISQHYNAGGGNGYDSIHSIYAGASRDLALLIANELEVLGQNPHGTGVWSKAGQNGDYYCEIRETNMPAVIVEPCFIDSDDRYIADTVEEQYRIAEAVCRAVCRFAGVDYIPEAQTTTEALKPIVATKAMYRVIMDGKQLCALSSDTKAIELGKQLVDEKRYNKCIIQRNTDLAEVFTYTLPETVVLVDNNILAVQKALNRLGFRGKNGLTLAEDGIIGINTRHALNIFQSVMGIPVTEEADSATWTALNQILAKPLNRVSAPRYEYATRYIQYRLGTGGDTRGIYWYGTARTVREYQASTGYLVADGEVGANTWKSLIG
jgi:N-acetylmuramoyl-L-alanine amidase